MLRSILTAHKWLNKLFVGQISDCKSFVNLLLISCKARRTENFTFLRSKLFLRKFTRCCDIPVYSTSMLSVYPRFISQFTSNERPSTYCSEREENYLFRFKPINSDTISATSSNNLFSCSIFSIIFKTKTSRKLLVTWKSLYSVRDVAREDVVVGTGMGLSFYSKSLKSVSNRPTSTSLIYFLSLWWAKQLRTKHMSDLSKCWHHRNWF